MTFDVFFSFEGNCREALGFYEQVFGGTVKDVMTYADAPNDPNMPVNEADKDLIMYACLRIGSCNVMFMDMPKDSGLVMGNNVSPTLGTHDKDEIKRVFAALSEGGTVNMPLEKMFFSELYGMVTDRFGIAWQISYEEVTQ